MSADFAIYRSPGTNILTVYAVFSYMKCQQNFTRKEFRIKGRLGFGKHFTTWSSRFGK